jgi:hypothetical protein
MHRDFVAAKREMKPTLERALNFRRESHHDVLNVMLPADL